METITTTLGALVDAEPFLRRVSSLPLKSKDVPDGITMPTKRHIVRLWSLVKAETDLFVAAQEQLFAALGIQGGQSIVDLPKGVWAEYLAQIKPHQNEPVTIACSPLAYEDIPQALAADVIGLGPLCELVEPDEPKKEPK